MPPASQQQQEQQQPPQPPQASQPRTRGRPRNPPVTPVTVTVDANHLTDLENEVKSLRSDVLNMRGLRAMCEGLVRRVMILEAARFGLPPQTSTWPPANSSLPRQVPVIRSKTTTGQQSNGVISVDDSDDDDDDEDDSDDGEYDNYDQSMGMGMGSPMQQLLNPGHGLDMAYPTEGQQFVCEMHIDAKGNRIIGGGPQGASAVLNAWCKTHGYRVMTRRSKVRKGLIVLTMCCKLHERKKPLPKPPPTAEDFARARAEGRRKPHTRRQANLLPDGSFAHNCPFRFTLHQVEPDSPVFEVRLMKSGGGLLPHNHGPDPKAMLPDKKRR
ncbi:hypothetical protein B0H66DRAFT_601201 [Apodospora peruviana]|uniref:Uncharacterized protein n=1 Tax=Apodospora peruviana TaxID=516989 RepID=A0AAE0IAR3_9PEZI|nr:hypothetical protein B0H66DRAFT_601201 [Apodospora peruviana]